MAPSSVVVANCLFVGCLLVACLQVRRVLPQERTIDLLALAFGLGTVACVGRLVHERLPAPFEEVFVHGATFLTYAALWSAVWARTGSGPPWRLIGIAGVGFAGGLFLIEPSPETIPYELAILSAIAATGFVASSARLALRPAAGPTARRMGNVAALFFGLLAVAMLTRSTIALIPSMGPSVAWEFTLVVFPSFYTAGGLCLLLGYVGDALTVSETLAATDPLTGIANRRGFEAAVREELLHGTAGRVPVVMVIADIDGLKAINDRFGHPAGDAVIQAVAAALLREGVPGERLARLGGDEFGLVVSGASTKAVEARLRRARRGLAKLTPGGIPAGLAQISFGVAEQGAGDSRDYADLYAAADRDLIQRRALLRAIA